MGTQRIPALWHALADALPKRVRDRGDWEIREHSLFTVDDWWGIEIRTPGQVIHYDEKAALREIFANRVSTFDWMFGFNELRFWHGDLIPRS